MDKTYIPSPIDTSDVIIPDELNELLEKVAKNTHEVWAQSRISQGWKWGKQRDDVLKTHPDLIPYEDLSEEEKDYDRKTSAQTIKMILRLGYNINRIK